MAGAAILVLLVLHIYTLKPVGESKMDHIKSQKAQPIDKKQSVVYQIVERWRWTCPTCSIQHLFDTTGQEILTCERCGEAFQPECGGYEHY